MTFRFVRGRLVPVLFALVALTVSITTSGASADGDHHKRPQRVESRSDDARQKLSADLQTTLDSGSTAPVAVVVTIQNGNVAQATNLLTNVHTAGKNGVSLVVGKVSASKLAKLAGVSGVVSVSSIQFKQTGTPTGNDPEVGIQSDRKTRNEALRAFQAHSVPFSKAPPLQTSNFDQQKSLNVLDAKTHNFTGAWKAGFAGTGVTVSVLDGGTDWGHPDLIGTWQTWSPADAANLGADPGWVGWPKAFDPYDTLVMLAAPDLIDQGLTWYTPTTSATCTYVTENGRPTTKDRRGALCSVSFGTRTGPSRNFAAPAGTNVHTYTFPASWTKSGTVRLTSHPDDYLLELYGERPAVLVTDPNTSGQYDTVYVDLSDDYDFSDEKPVTKGSPVSYRDLNGDGYTDLSGGLLYYISDGHTTIPGGPTDFGVTDTPAPGAFLAWTGDFDTGIEGHGTLTASNIVGQGVINGKAPSFADLVVPGRHGDHHDGGRDDGRDGNGRDGRGGTIPGMVLGGAPKARLAPMGDIYFAFDFSTQFGYLLTNEWGVNVTSNSYGGSAIDNDGMDAASQEADIIHQAIGGRTVTPLFSTGNGAPGFGTVTAPSPVLGIQVGASTNFGSTGWDSIVNYSQVTDNDVIEWSNRGPGANGRNGVDVVADGSYAPGDATLNTVIDGQNAWTTWGGTSRSTPVAVGATALIYQAWAAAHGGAFPTEPTVKSILKSSAKDLGYDGFIQGAGSIDAGKAVSAATGAAGFVTPDEWRPTTDPAAGPSRLAFPQTIHPGESATQSFAVTGPGNWTVSDRVLKKVDSETFPFKSSSITQESTPNFNAPDYLMNITDKIRAHSSADLVVIKANYPHSQFDGDNNYAADQSWRLLAYNWTDINHNGRLWRDANGNGVVNHVDKTTSSNIDGFNDINFDRSEMDRGEYERFFYHRPGSNALTGFIQHPAQRMASGIYLGFQHSKANPALDKTDFTIEITYYKNVDWAWASELTQPGTSGSFQAQVAVPSDAPYGMYEGSLVASNGSQSAVIPVAVTVGAVASQNADGSIASPIVFGGDAVAAAQSDSLYNNGSIFGANDWTWRQESGDWRFFYYDVQHPVPAGTLFLTDTVWPSDPAFTDLDTLIFGRSANSYQLFGGSSPIFAPYILDTVGKSANAYIGSGTWKFSTATGGPEDIVAAPASPGLHAVVQHGVGWDGDKFNVPFKTTVGSASVSPTSVHDSTGHFQVTFKSSVALSGFRADAFGLSQPAVLPETVQQDDPNDPSTAHVKVNRTLHHASRADFTISVGTDDIDMYVLYDANGDHLFTPDEIVGSSTGPAGADEQVTLVAPPDGDYQIWLHGFQVAGTPTDNLGVSIIQGTDLHLTGVPVGPVPANTPITLNVTYALPAASGSYLGELLFGPDSAPTAVSVPVTVTVP